jgi:FkbM family methyltransferase
LGSQARYFAWRLAGGPRTLKVRLKGGLIMLLRPMPAHDFGIATEIFAQGVYEFPEALRDTPIRRIVDLGANVGYSCLYWLQRFPDAEIIAFEPHPVHLAQLRSHLTVNRCGNRVVVHPVAAGVTAGRAAITDRGGGSRVVDVSNPDGTAPIEVVDVFERIGGLDIDLLKMDIEGAEYALLADPRFDSVRARAIVLEWHQTSDPVAGADWCTNRLRQAGYAVFTGPSESTHGILWGVRG